MTSKSGFRPSYLKIIKNQRFFLRFISFPQGKRLPTRNRTFCLKETRFGLRKTKSEKRKAKSEKRKKKCSEKIEKNLKNVLTFFNFFQILHHPLRSVFYRPPSPKITCQINMVFVCVAGDGQSQVERKM